VRIVVNAPNGNIGRKLCPRLLDAGADLTVITRSLERAGALALRGARLVLGSIDDAATLHDAFAQAEVLFWLPPLAPEQADFLRWSRRTGIQAATVAQECGIRRAVLLSSVGAQHETGVGPIGCMPAIEGAFSACVPDLRILRAGHFMENFIPHLASALGTGQFFTPHPSDLPMPMVATRDIAAKVAQLCLDSTWHGQQIEGIHGPFDISHAEAAAILSEVFGRPVSHHPCTPAQAASAMIGAGLPEPIALLVAELYDGIAQGRVKALEPRTAASTTPTSFEQFAREELLPMAKASSA